MKNLSSAPRKVRERIREEWLAFLENPESAKRKIRRHLLSDPKNPDTCGACALGALGLVLARHGYADLDVDDRGLGTVSVKLADGRKHTDEHCIPAAVGRALGVRLNTWGCIPNWNDGGADFTAIAERVRADLLRLPAPATARSARA